MFERYAIFYTPDGPLADFGARWLGWDSARGRAGPHIAVDGIDVALVTDTPRKYGMHGTLKAPFRLAQGTDIGQVQGAVADFATRYPAFAIGQMELRDDAGFVALRPGTKSKALQDFAATVVKAFDPFRAPMGDADIARRRKSQLTARQDRQMLDWGYPFIFDDFHFHLTLTGALPANDAATVMTALQSHLSPVVPNPFLIDAITLMGQDHTGMFHQIHRSTLTG